MELLANLNEANVIEIVVILAVTWLGILLSQRCLPWLAKRFSGRQQLYILASAPVFRLLLIIVAITLIIPRVIEPTFENLVAVLGTLGIALGFAFKDYISSLFAGIVTLYEIPYRVGDWITIEDTYGEVRKIGSRSLEIVTPDDTVVVIPHQKLWATAIHNANDGSQFLMCIADFYLHPQHDAMQVKTSLREVALTSAYLQLDRPVIVVIQEQPWGTHYRLKAYPAEPRNQFFFTTDLTVRGKAALAELDVAFSAVPFARN